MIPNNYVKLHNVGTGDPAQFQSFISEVNRSIKPFGMEVAKAHMEDTGDVWYGLVNRNTDAAAAISSGYTLSELELFNKTVGIIDINFSLAVCYYIILQLEMIVTSENGMASSTDVLRIVPNLERKLTHREAQTFLKNLCKDMWLKEKVRNTPRDSVPITHSLTPKSGRCILPRAPFHLGT